MHVNVVALQLFILWTFLYFGDHSYKVNIRELRGIYIYKLVLIKWNSNQVFIWAGDSIMIYKLSCKWRIYIIILLIQCVFYSKWSVGEKGREWQGIACNPNIFEFENPLCCIEILTILAHSRHVILLCLLKHGARNCLKQHNYPLKVVNVGFQYICL